MLRCKSFITSSSACEAIYDLAGKINDFVSENNVKVVSYSHAAIEGTNLHCPEYTALLIYEDGTAYL